MKYDFKEFADEAMVALVQLFHSYEQVGKIEPSVANTAVREAYCSENTGDSKLRQIIAEEICKYELFINCKVKGCENCKHHRAHETEIPKELNCSRSKDAGHRCGLVKDLSSDIMKIKKRFLDAKNVEARLLMFKRLSRRQGKLPYYTTFLVSTHWKDLISSIL